MPSLPRNARNGRLVPRSARYYVRVQLEGTWRCFAIIDEPRSVAEAVAGALREQWSDPVEVHTRHEVTTPAHHRRAVEQSRLEWDPVVVDAFVAEAKSRRVKDPPAWTQTTARSARRGLQDLEVALRTDRRAAAIVAKVAGLDEKAVKAIRAGHGTLCISLDMK